MALSITLVAMVALLLLRLYSLIRTVYWIQTYGATFALAIQDLSPDKRNLENYAPMYDATRGAFFPFGVKSYRLHRAYRRARARGRPVRAVLLFGARRVWVLWFLAPAVAVTLALSDVIAGQGLSNLQKALGLCVGILLCACMTTVAAEAAFSAGAFNSWAGPHHRFRQSVLADAKIIVGSALTTWIVASGFYYFAINQFGGFKKINPNAGELELIIDSVRFGLSTLVTGTDAEPESVGGKASVLTIQVTGIAYIVGLIGICGSLLVGPPDEGVTKQAATRDEQPVSTSRPSRRTVGAVGAIVTFAIAAWRFRNGI
ncbi:hypothetical protein ACFQV2_02340 [Actinokineospora soli]|uniref:Uncharacterized protein n=1 Tax=Actinokineospora soli TaxID=1048753 RepID=A0ABW2TJ99_9PSEU